MSDRIDASYFTRCVGGPQRDFDEVEGIVESVVGYSGSKDPKFVDPTYKNIQDCKLSIVHF